MAKGEVPSTIDPFICGARLHAGIKKDGSLRPIAVGNMERRLVSKLFVLSLNDRIVSRLAPHQLGVAVKGGCEAAAHTIREAVSRDPSKWVLRMDLVNAFNCLDRSANAC